MKDLDFDELDRAVTSIMNGGSSKDASRSAPTSQKVDTSSESQRMAETAQPFQDVVTQPSTNDTYADLKERTLELSPSLSSSVSAPADTSESLSNSPFKDTDTLSSSIERAPVAVHNLHLPKRRQSPGRFMDVVRPQVSPTPTKVSREGVTIGAPEKLHNAQEAETPVVDADAAITVSGASPLSASTEILPSEPASVPPVTMTPFLSDAKVEKRPLGFQEPSPQVVEDVADDKMATASVELPTVQSPVQSSDQLEQVRSGDALPEEYQSDLMAVEASELTRSEPDPMPTPEEQIAPKNVAPIQEPTHSQEHIHESVDIDHRLEPPHLSNRPDSTQSLTTSIPRQYSETPSTGDKESGPIFDTTTYHQPLSHPAKKKSGWMWIVWILLVIALGAACGVALYFFAL